RGRSARVGPAHRGRGGTEIGLEGAAEGALAFKTNHLGDVADGQPGISHQGPGSADAQPVGVFERSFAENFAIQADQVRWRIVRNPGQAGQVQANATTMRDQVAYAHEAQEDLFTALTGSPAAGVE